MKNELLYLSNIYGSSVVSMQKEQERLAVKLARVDF
jgi:hypothetical protein